VPDVFGLPQGTRIYLANTKMKNNNIPAGYDENGIRAGNGKWESPRCHRCNVKLEDTDSVRVGKLGDQKELCEVCAEDMGVI
jgi:hypothetical protein